VIEVTALTFSKVVNPVTFKVISITLCKDSITVSLTLVPLALIDVLVGIDHTTLALWKSVDPVAIVSVSILIVESSSSVLLVLVPVSGVLTTELGALVLPVGSLTVALVLCPHALILISILVKLNSEALLEVVSPVTDILLGGLPDLALNRTILLCLFLLHPIYTSMSSILLGLCIINLPEMHELTLWLMHRLHGVLHCAVVAL